MQAAITAFFLFLSEQTVRQSLLLWIGAIGVERQYSESLLYRFAHVGDSIGMCANTQVIVKSVKPRNICIGIEKILECVCRELLAEPGTVIHLFIAVVNESGAVDAPVIVLTEHHVYAAQGQYRHESVTVATATVLGKGDIIRNLRLPFLRLVVTRVVADTFLYPLIPEPLANKR